MRHILYCEQPAVHRGCLFQASFVGNAEFPAALFAATGEDFTTVFRFHALAKAVLVPTGAAGRLVCTFHRLSNVDGVMLFKNGAQR